MTIRIEQWALVWGLMTKPPLSTDWVVEGNLESCSHYTDAYDDPIEDKNMMMRHILLEFLDYLKVIEYTRGYDGYYYDVTIRK